MRRTQVMLLASLDVEYSSVSGNFNATKSDSVWGIFEYYG